MENLTSEIGGDEMKTYTHLGWLGFCPIYLAGPYTGTPDITPRKPWLMPLLRLNIWLQELSICVCAAVNPDWEPTWRIRLTGKLL